MEQRIEEGEEAETMETEDELTEVEDLELLGGKRNSRIHVYL